MATSVQVICIEAIQAAIQALTLTDLPSVKVYKKKLPTDRGLQNDESAIIVSLPDDTGESIVDGTNNSTDIAFPCLITFVHPGDQNNEIDADTDKWMLWRETVFLEFHHQRLAGVSGDTVYICKVTPKAIVDLRLFINQNRFAGALLIHCLSRQAPR